MTHPRKAAKTKTVPLRPVDTVDNEVLLNWGKKHVQARRGRQAADYPPPGVDSAVYRTIDVVLRRTFSCRLSLTIHSPAMENRVVRRMLVPQDEIQLVQAHQHSDASTISSGYAGLDPKEPKEPFSARGGERHFGPVTLTGTARKPTNGHLQWCP